MRKKNIAIVLLLTILVLGSLLRYLLFWPDLSSIAKESPLVVFCKVEPNGNGEILTIQNVWKDTRKSRSNLIGLKVNYFAESTNQVPSDAVVFYERRPFYERPLFEGGRLEIGYVYYGTDGTVGGMTLDQFKTACGL